MGQFTDITAVILAGGRGSRMQGKDKGLVELNGQPLIKYVLSAITPQVGKVIISANRNIPQYASMGHSVVCDSMSNFQGPLAGILAAMNEANTADIVIVPCDGPLLSHDLVERLVAGRKQAAADVAIAHDGQRLQLVYSLIPTHLKNNLQTFLESGDRKLGLWIAQQRTAHVDFSDTPNTFMNINTPSDQKRVQRQLMIP